MSDIKMPNTNSVIIAGRATRDEEFSYTEGGSAYLNIGIANNQNWRNKSGEWINNPVYVNATLWGKAAERMQNKIKKGDPIIIEGKLSSYTKEIDGKKQTIVSINAFRVQKLTKDSIEQSEESQDAEEVPAHIEERKPQEEPEEKDLPF